MVEVSRTHGWTGTCQAGVPHLCLPQPRAQVGGVSEGQRRGHGQGKHRDDLKGAPQACCGHRNSSSLAMERQPLELGVTQTLMGSGAAGQKEQPPVRAGDLVQEQPFPTDAWSDPNALPESPALRRHSCLSRRGCPKPQGGKISNNQIPVTPPCLQLLRAGWPGPREQT